MDPFQIALIVLSALMLPLIIWMIAVSVRVNTTFARYKRVASASGKTAAQVAREILNANGLYTVDIRHTSGHLSDHYNPADNCVYLSDSTYTSNSVSAIAVAAHEVGHAIQYAEDYAPVKMRAALVPAVNFTSRLSLPLLLLAMILEIFSYSTGSVSYRLSNILLLLAVVCYGVYCLFTFITLPTELNASSRAKKILRDHEILNEEECAQASKVLHAAAMTYVVSFVMSLWQMLRLLFVFLARRNNNN